MKRIAIEGTRRHIDVYPDSCPMCHHAVEPKYLLGVERFDEPLDRVQIEIAFQCPKRSCRRIFIGRYEGSNRGGSSGTLHLQATAPYLPATPTLPEEVRKISDQFALIYGQAAAAEAYGLHEVAGCGYRKAVEFLIKDFCVSKEPDHADEIEKKWLGAVISDHVADEYIKECARRATWLGNDETHYLRKWADKDLEDLKTLVSLTVSWINTNLLTAKYLNEMDSVED